MIKLNYCGYSLVVEHVLAKDETGFRLPLSAQNNETNAIAFVEYIFVRIGVIEKERNIFFRSGAEKKFERRAREFLMKTSPFRAKFEFRTGEAITPPLFFWHTNGTSPFLYTILKN